MATTRKNWLDIAKGIAIILMVLSHSSLPEVMQRFIFSFHMPLFFIASGLTSHYTRQGLAPFARHKARGLLVPFFWYSLIVLACLWPMGRLTPAALLTEGWGSWALWFIPVLFVAQVAVRAVCLIGSKKGQWAAAAVLLAAGCALSYAKVHLPWTLATVPYAAFLLFLANRLAPLIPSVEHRGRWWDVLPAALVALLVSHFARLDMAQNIIVPVTLITLGALAGTFMTFRLSRLVDLCLPRTARLLAAVGRETYLILAFSQLIITALNSYLPLPPPARYLLLILALTALKYIKDLVKAAVHKGKKTTQTA